MQGAGGSAIPFLLSSPSGVSEATMTRFEMLNRGRPYQRSRLPFLLFTFFLVQSSLVEAQQRQQKSGEEVARRFIMAVATTEEMSIDGELNESSWVTAGVSQRFLQRDPQEGQLATEPTEIRILYDKEELYVAVISYDSEPDKILAGDRQRDSLLVNDDTVALVLDTFHDLRNGYLFKTNALGAKHDAHITDEGRNISRGWDENWRVAGKITEDGWIAEFAIPFKSIRTSGKESQTWGLEVERIIRRKNEFTYWNGYQRGYKLENISQAGLLQGLQDLEAGYKLRVKPFAVAGLSHHSDRLTSDTDNESDVGMEVMKYRITPSLTADVTLNSNFIETEVDRQRVNLDRWELFYPERREFFLEGAGIFKFGVALGEMPAPDVALFHSRRIGVHTTVSDVSSSSRNVEVPIHAGLRVTGQLAGFGLGLLNVQTGEVPSEGVTQNNYGVVRIKRNVFERSSVGMFFLNREISGSGDYNRVLGVDSNFVFARHLIANALFAKSSEPGVDGDNWTSSGGARWDSDFLFAAFNYMFLEPNFRDDLGFIPRVNQRRLSPEIYFKPRPNNRLIRKIQFGYRLDYISDQDWSVQTRYNHSHFHVWFQSGDHLLIAPPPPNGESERILPTAARDYRVSRRV